MNRRDNDELEDIPRMAPAQDEVAGRRSLAGQSQGSKRSSSHGGGASREGGGLLSIISLLIAITAMGAAYFLWDQSRLTNASAKSVEQRLIVLESQLASTGDELSQSDAAVRVQLKTVDTEVRKLWDARKKSIKLLNEHDVSVRNLTTRTSGLKKQYSAAMVQLTALAAELDEVVETLETAQITSLQKNVGNTSQKVQQMSKSVDSLSGRVLANEEWLEAINAFRRQVNDRLNALQNPTNPTPVLQ